MFWRGRKILYDVLVADFSMIRAIWCFFYFYRTGSFWHLSLIGLIHGGIPSDYLPHFDSSMPSYFLRWLDKLASLLRRHLSLICKVAFNYRGADKSCQQLLEAIKCSITCTTSRLPFGMLDIYYRCFAQAVRMYNNYLVYKLCYLWT